MFVRIHEAELILITFLELNFSVAFWGICYLKQQQQFAVDNTDNNSFGFSPIGTVQDHNASDI